MIGCKRYSNRRRNAFPHSLVFVPACSAKRLCSCFRTVQRAIIYDVRIKPRTISTTTGSKDLQMVTLSLRVLSRPDVGKLAEVYRKLGQDYDERVLPSIGNEVLKATVANYDAAELIVRRINLCLKGILIDIVEQTQREVVSSRIREDLLRRAREFNIQLEDVSITHLTVSTSYLASAFKLMSI